MKLFKKFLIGLFVLVLLSLIFGYLYFDHKFSPDKNYLQVNNESGKVLIKWETEEKEAMLLPINFDADTTTYYLQFDTGSPYTIFYKKSTVKIHQIDVNNEVAKSSFRIGNTQIKSSQFKVIDFGEAPSKGKINIIGTIGTDLLENRRTIINFKENYVQFNLDSDPVNFKNRTFEFSFKKRKIIIPTILDSSNEQFLYDSGTSGYELLTTKEIWNKLRLKNKVIRQDKGQSWTNVLTTYTAETNKKIEFLKTKISLKEVTYVEGYSKTQYYLMKFSGMSGMLGNKIFLKKQLYIDANNMRMSIE